MKTQDLLMNAYASALDAIEPTRGSFTMMGITGSGVNVGKVELKSGRVALVKLSIEADEDEIEHECDDLDALPELSLIAPQKQPNDNEAISQKIRALIATVELTDHKIGLSTLKQLQYEIDAIESTAAKYVGLRAIIDKHYENEESNLCDIGLSVTEYMGYL